MTCTALVLRKHDLKLQSVVAINQTVLTNTLQMVKTNEYNTITYIKSSNHNIHWTQRNITYQRNSNKMSPASARSPTLRNGSNDATDKCTEDRRPVCRSTITKTKFKISQPKGFLPVHTEASAHPTGVPGCDLLPRLANRTKSNFTG